jgi:hypothetical protein
LKAASKGRLVAQTPTNINSNNVNYTEYWHYR